MSTLRHNLAFLMSKYQLTANTLAKETGVPQPTISRILSGESSDPRTQTIQPLAERFGLEAEDLRSSIVAGAEAFSYEEQPDPASRRKGLRDILDQKKHSAKTEVIAGPRLLRNNDAARFNELRRRAQEEIAEQITSQLRGQATRNFMRGPFVYLSDRLVLEIRIYPAGPNVTFDSPSWVQRLWELSCYRLQCLDNFPDRDYVLAAIFVDFDLQADTYTVARDWLTPHGYQHLAAQAELHSIYMLATTPEALVDIVQRIEKTDL